MATQNGQSCEHITHFFLNLIGMRFLADPNVAEVKLMLLRGETVFFVRSLKHYSVLIFNFSDIKRGYKYKN